MNRHKWILLFILLLAFGLRVWGLADHNVWWDEGWSIWLARMPAWQAIQVLAPDNHPPLHHLLLRGWWLVLGDGEFVMRFSSVLAGVLWVALTYGLGRALGGSRAGLLAALFVTLSRFAVSWSQEMRMYTWAAALATGVLWVVVRLWRSQGWRAWAVYILAVTAGLFSLYLTVSAPLIANMVFPLIWLLLNRPRRLLTLWITAQLIIAALYIPWLLYVPGLITYVHNVQPLSLLAYLRLYITMLAVGVPVNLEAYTPLTLAVLGVLALGLAALWRARRSPVQTVALAMLMLGLVVPLVVAYVVVYGFIYSNYVQPLAPRYLLPLSSCFYVLLAWGVDALARRRRWGIWAAWALGALVAVVSLIGLSSFYPGRARRDDYISIAQVLCAHRRPGDAVLLYVDRDWPIFVAHYTGEWQGVHHEAALEVASIEALLAPVWETSDGVWLVTTPESLMTDPQRAVPRWLESHAAHWETLVDGENSLAFYARTEARRQTFYELAPGFEPPANVKAEVGNEGRLLGAAIPLPRYRTGDTLRLSLFWSPPPSTEVIVELAGPDARPVTAGISPPAPSGATRQPVNIPLTPDMPGGQYWLRVRAGEDPPLKVGRFTLVRHTAGSNLAITDISNPVDYRLGEVIQLIGYDLPRAAVKPGGLVELTLYWQAKAPIPERYKVFTHLLGEVYNASSNNFLWGQQDNEPGNGQLLTTLWTPGAVIVDTYRVPVDPAAPPGVYTLEIGMYGLADGARQPVFGPNGQPQGDAIFLAQVTVSEP